MFAVSNPVEGDTAEQIAAFDAYSEAARAFHDLQISKSASPLEERAAFHNLLRLQKDVRRAFGADDGAGEIMSLRRQHHELKTSVRRAYSLLRAADVMGKLREVPDDQRALRDGTVIDLVFLAEDLLAAEVEKELH